ncbi:DUF983 domain-containing protein [Kordiimonas lipolytica]|uniref:DUF983 domain-containing protein n=1 Tax=Kordiimonas lipolytica TaxID=1662421 RepID=A0ABV8U9X0_9PROT|nr:DUF983 domain-containing protein [Kordiimonas lipolytica]
MQNKEKEAGREQSRSVSPYRAGFLGRCPKCGEGAFFKPMSLDIRDTCDVCGFDLRAADPGDGAQVFVILIMGAIAALVGFILIGGMHMPPWLAMTIIFALILFGSIWMLRVFKATLVALQFHHDAAEGRLTDGEDKDA